MKKAIGTQIQDPGKTAFWQESRVKNIHERLYWSSDAAAPVMISTNSPVMTAWRVRLKRIWNLVIISPAFLEAFCGCACQLDAFYRGLWVYLMYSRPWHCGGLIVHMHGLRQEPKLLISMSFMALEDIIVPSKANWQARILEGW